MDLVNVTFNVFEIFDGIAALFPETTLMEISVRQHQITLIFEQEFLPINCLKEEYFKNVTDGSFLMSVEDRINLVLPFKKNLPGITDDYFVNLTALIKEISDKVCKCPALEIVFSGQYLKCYLDKPGLSVEDLLQYEKLFDSKGTLELHAQRPYLLFIKEVDISEENYD